MCMSTHGSDDCLDREEGLGDGDGHTSLSTKEIEMVDTVTKFIHCFHVFVYRDRGFIIPTQWVSFTQKSTSRGKEEGGVDEAGGGWLL